MAGTVRAESSTVFEAPKGSEMARQDSAERQGSGCRGRGNKCARGSTVEWPGLSGVAVASRPRWVQVQEPSAAAVDCRMTTRSPAALFPTSSYGSWVPVCRFVDEPKQRAGGVEHEQVVVVRRATERIRPIQIHTARGEEGIEVEAPSCADARPGNGSATRRRRRISFPDAGGSVGQIAGVAGRREEQRAGSCHVLDRLDHRSTIRVGRSRRPVLKGGLDEIEHVVDDDVAPARKSGCSGQS